VADCFQEPLLGWVQFTRRQNFCPLRLILSCGERLLAHIRSGQGSRIDEGLPIHRRRDTVDAMEAAMEETAEDRRRRLGRERSARWRAANPERDRELRRGATERWRAAHPEKVRQGSDSEQHREASREWNKANRERVRAAGRRWLEGHRASALLRRCQSSAKGRGHDCSLTLTDVEALLRPMTCSVTGVPLSWEWEAPGSNPWAPSIDRIDGSYGYHLENVRLVCWAFNRARGTWPDEVFLAMARSATEARRR